MNDENVRILLKAVMDEGFKCVDRELYKLIEKEQSYPIWRIMEFIDMKETILVHKQTWYDFEDPYYLLKIGDRIWVRLFGIAEKGDPLTIFKWHLKGQFHLWVRKSLEYEKPDGWSIF